MLNKKQIKDLENYIIDLEDFNLRIDKGVIQAKELDNKFYEGKEEIHNLFTKDSDEWRFFDSWKQKYMLRNRLRGNSYAIEKDKIKILDLISIIREILNMNSRDSVEKKEFSFNKGDVYEATKFVLKILKSANNKIVIIDNFLDDTIFDYLESIDENIEIFLLTDDKKPIFKKLFISFSNKRKGICAKFNNSSHDRYIMIDDKDFYGLGASINHIGKKSFMIHKIETNEERSRIMKDFDNWWSVGKNIE